MSGHFEFVEGSNVSYSIGVKSNCKLEYRLSLTSSPQKSVFTTFEDAFELPIVGVR